MSKVTILGIDFSKGSERDILEQFWQKLENSNDSFYVVTPNPEMVVKACEDSKFKDTLNSAEIALADGVGITWAAGILGAQGLSRVTGVDFMESICRDSVEKAVTIGLLGGQAGVAERASERLKKKYPGLKVVFAKEEWESSATSIDVLFVAFGFPKQEFWMKENLGKIPVKSMMGVGGAFDYISGETKRAPKFLQELGLEWLYRLIHEPWRIKRQLALPKFVLLVLQEKF